MQLGTWGWNFLFAQLSQFVKPLVVTIAKPKHFRNFASSKLKDYFRASYQQVKKISHCQLLYQVGFLVVFSL